MAGPELPVEVASAGAVGRGGTASADEAPERRLGGLRRRAALWSLATLVVVAVAVGLARGAWSLGWEIVLTVTAALLVVGLLRMAVAAVVGDRVDVSFWLAAGWLVAIALFALLAPLLPLAEHQNVALSLTAPTYAGPDLGSAHLLGTNHFGLDILARLAYGARVSLVVALASVLIGALVGGTIGVAVGYRQGVPDRVMGVLTNSLLSVPPLILLIALASVLEASLVSTILALSILTVPGMLRVARANTITASQREYVVVARAIGATGPRIIFRELLPNIVLPVATMGIVLLSVLVVAEASLSFLGLGVQPPQPSWGNMIAEGRGGVLEDHPHIVLVPGVALFLTIFSLNVVAEKARTRWDPERSRI